jgi:hypothetical protein
MKNWEIYHSLSNGFHLSHSTYFVVCCLMFFLPLYAVVRSFSVGAYKDEDSQSRIQLYTRHTIWSWLLQFRTAQEYEVCGMISRMTGANEECVSAFEINGHSFGCGEGSINSGIDVGANGGLLVEGIFYQMKHDGKGRIIHMSVSREDWFHLCSKIYHPADAGSMDSEFQEGCDKIVIF